MNHCDQITRASREWMQNNFGKELPRDYEQYPGKMDHTTCVVVRVGNSSWFKKQETKDFCISKQDYSPISVTLLTNTSYVKICCKTIARGRVS